MATKKTTASKAVKATTTTAKADAKTEKVATVATKATEKVTAPVKAEATKKVETKAVETKVAPMATTAEVKAEPKKAEKVEEKKEIIVTDMKKTLYVKATSLNVRSGPSTSDGKIGAYKNAAEVTVTGKVKDSTWYRVSYNGKVGYVDSTYLTETKPVIEEKSYEEEAVSTTGSTVSNLIVINSRNNTLRYYINGNLTRSYSCATGKSSSATPTGKFSVYNKIVNRPYYKNNIPGGDPRNPLGKRWMGLDCYERRDSENLRHRHRARHRHRRRRQGCASGKGPGQRRPARGRGHVPHRSGRGGHQAHRGRST